jgi:dienelactone hydrolase
MEWTDEDSIEGNVIERGFCCMRVENATAQPPGGTRAIPGVLWRPVQSGSPRPLILLGHGGSGHKRNERMVMLGRMFSESFGWLAASIDGPVHGDRGPVSDPTHPAYSAMWSTGDPVGDMISDWTCVLDALCERADVDAAKVGYWGLSMGTMFGLPLVASERRIRAAVLGKAGMSGTSVDRSGIDTYFEQYADQVRQPVLFTMQWDDERFERDGQLSLFDRLGSADKRLQAYPGRHVENGPDAFESQAAFLARYLA